MWDINLEQGYFARYFYLLLIDAHNIYNDRNIDITSVIPLAKRIKIKNI